MSLLLCWPKVLANSDEKSVFEVLGAVAASLARAVFWSADIAAALMLGGTPLTVILDNLIKAEGHGPCGS